MGISKYNWVTDGAVSNKLISLKVIKFLCGMLHEEHTTKTGNVFNKKAKRMKMIEYTS
jgi:hypothetical protein